jgi:hypothetical protein
VIRKLSDREVSVTLTELNMELDFPKFPIASPIPDFPTGFRHFPHLVFLALAVGMGKSCEESCFFD